MKEEKKEVIEMLYYYLASLCFIYLMAYNSLPFLESNPLFSGWKGLLFLFLFGISVMLIRKGYYVVKNK